ncbi:MAG: head GIN domain-containing protein [bacterium]
MPARRFLLAATVLQAFTFACGDAAAWKFKRSDRLDGSGDLTTERIELDDFDAIELDGSMDIYVQVGGEQRVEVTIDDNLFDNLILNVRGRTLEIDWDKNCDPSHGCRMEIVVSQLARVTINGAGDVEIPDFRGEFFEFNLHGAGDLEIAGEVGELEIQLSGAGNVDAQELVAQEVDVRVSGAGNAKVYAVDRLRGVVSGVGNLTYYGKPEHVSTNVSVIGSIKRR